MERKWSVTQNLKETVKNPNIMIKGTHSYYSHAWEAVLKMTACAICTAMNTA